MIGTLKINSNTYRWLELILAERFGHKWRLWRNKDKLFLTLIDADGAIVFDELWSAWAGSTSDLPFTKWSAESEDWISCLGSSIPAPGMGSLRKPLIEQFGSEYVIHYDIFGLMYWMLGRIEEIGRIDLDKHQRFSAFSSHAYKYEYLERPIIDEWLNILAQVIKRKWPRLKLKSHVFSTKVSHDVDAPSLYAFKSWSAVGRMMAGHLLKRYDPLAFVVAPYLKAFSQKRIHSSDPFNTFDWLMDVSERNDQKSAFYFICGKTDPERDADYEIKHPSIGHLLRRINERGHEIGLHPSYNTYKSPALIRHEANLLKQICSENKIKQHKFGGRMHYLRWEHPITLRAWSQAGMSYDSSLGYADHAGFRCGTCFEYPAFDPVKHEILKLRIRPLIAMEATVIDQRYMGLGTGEEAEAKLRTLKENCEKVKGCFTLLWHNSHLHSRPLRDLYQTIVEK